MRIPITSKTKLLELTRIVPALQKVYVLFCSLLRDTAPLSTQPSASWSLLSRDNSSLHRIFSVPGKISDGWKINRPCYYPTPCVTIVRYVTHNGHWLMKWYNYIRTNEIGLYYSFVRISISFRRIRLIRFVRKNYFVCIRNNFFRRNKLLIRTNEFIFQ